MERMRLPAAGEDLVGIGLVADVPDQPVTRGVEYIMERHGEFDDAKATAEMPACLRRGGNNLRPQLRRKPRQFRRTKTPERLGRGDTVEQGCQSVHTDGL